MKTAEILLEYNRQITIDRMGDKILNALEKISISEAPAYFSSTITMLKIIRRTLTPGSFPEGAYMDVDTPYGKIRIGKNNAKEIFDKYRDNIIAYALEYFENLDPTKNKEYVKWMIECFVRSGLIYYAMPSDISHSLKYLLQAHENGKRRGLIKPEHSDINKFKTIQDFITAMTTSNYNLYTLLGMSEYHVIYDGPDATVIMPRNVHAACEFGTENWCTSNKGAFNNYISDGPLYIILPKKPTYPAQKYQISVARKEFKDEEDEPVDEYELLIDQFPGAGQAIVAREPELQEWVVFSNTDSLKQTWDIMCEKILQQALLLVADQEIEDSDYYRMLENNGCIDESGEYDWERIERLGLSYLEYDVNSRRAIQSVERIRSISGDQIKNNLIEYGNDNHSDSSVADMNQVASNMLWEERENINDEADLLSKLAEWASFSVRVVLTDRLNKQIEMMKNIDTKYTRFINMNQTVVINKKTEFTQAGNFTIVIER